MSQDEQVAIDKLIEVVMGGGSVKTGIDVFNDHGVLLLEKDVVVTDVKPLQIIKNAGIVNIPFSVRGSGGAWDKHGISIVQPGEPSEAAGTQRRGAAGSLAKRIRKINEVRELAREKHQTAKACIKKVLDDIQRSGGEFDYQEVVRVVTELIEFLTEHENAFSYLTREIFSYDDYLYNHSINVCTIATAALHMFNRSFSTAVNRFLNGLSFESLIYGAEPTQDSFVLYSKEEIQSITIGFFLHDVGKVIIPDRVLNKKGPLDRNEYDLVKLHSHDKGQEILDKSGVQGSIVRNVVRFHHCALYRDEPKCYPSYLPPTQMPPYVKVCKLADIYDAMTSRRCYKEAFNPISVVTDLFRKYANRDKLLQFIMDSFVRTVGIYPAGSVVKLRNGQQAYIVDSDGPIAVPFTSRDGTPFKVMQEPVHLGEEEKRDPEFGIDQQEPLASPTKAYESLPDYLKVPLGQASG